MAFQGETATKTCIFSCDTVNDRGAIYFGIAECPRSARHQIAASSIHAVVASCFQKQVAGFSEMSDLHVSILYALALNLFCEIEDLLSTSTPAMDRGSSKMFRCVPQSRSVSTQQILLTPHLKRLRLIAMEQNADVVTADAFAPPKCNIHDICIPEIVELVCQSLTVTEIRAFARAVFLPASLTRDLLRRKLRRPFALHVQSDDAIREKLETFRKEERTARSLRDLGGVASDLYFESVKGLSNACLDFDLMVFASSVFTLDFKNEIYGIRSSKNSDAAKRHGNAIWPCLLHAWSNNYTVSVQDCTSLSLPKGFEGWRVSYRLLRWFDLFKQYEESQSDALIYVRSADAAIVDAMWKPRHGSFPDPLMTWDHITADKKLAHLFPEPFQRRVLDPAVSTRLFDTCTFDELLSDKESELFSHLETTAFVLLRVLSCYEKLETVPIMRHPVLRDAMTAVTDLLVPNSEPPSEDINAFLAAIETCLTDIWNYVLDLTLAVVCRSYAEIRDFLVFSGYLDLRPVPTLRSNGQLFGDFFNANTSITLGPLSGDTTAEATRALGSLTLESLIPLPSGLEYKNTTSYSLLAELLHLRGVSPWIFQSGDYAMVFVGESLAIESKQELLSQLTHDIADVFLSAQNRLVMSFVSMASQCDRLLRHLQRYSFDSQAYLPWQTFSLHVKHESLCKADFYTIVQAMRPIAESHIDDDLLTLLCAHALLDHAMKARHERRHRKTCNEDDDKIAFSELDFGNLDDMALDHGVRFYDNRKDISSYVVILELSFLTALIGPRISELLQHVTCTADEAASSMLPIYPCSELSDEV